MAEGRSDIATKVRAYRGGYSQEVRAPNLFPTMNPLPELRTSFRTDELSRKKRLQEILWVLLRPMLLNLVLISDHVRIQLLLFFEDVD